jgi:hypothetical protein
VKGKGFIILSTVFVSFTTGYFFAGTARSTIHFKKDVQFQEVRDNYFRRCEAQGATLRTDGAIEETWSCPKMKLFLVKRFATIASEPHAKDPN